MNSASLLSPRRKRGQTTTRGGIVAPRSPTIANTLKPAARKATRAQSAAMPPPTTAIVVALIIFPIATRLLSPMSVRLSLSLGGCEPACVKKPCSTSRLCGLSTLLLSLLRIRKPQSVARSRTLRATEKLASCGASKPASLERARVQRPIWLNTSALHMLGLSLTAKPSRYQPSTLLGKRRASAASASSSSRVKLSDGDSCQRKKVLRGYRSSCLHSSSS